MISRVFAVFLAVLRQLRATLLNDQLDDDFGIQNPFMLGVHRRIFVTSVPGFDAQSSLIATPLIFRVAAISSSNTFIAALVAGDRFLLPDPPNLRSTSCAYPSAPARQEDVLPDEDTAGESGFDVDFK